MANRSTFPTSHTHVRTRHGADEVIASFLMRHFETSARPVIIAIGGPGGSGKTTFADKLRNRLPSCGVIHLDNYKTSRSERQMRGLAGPHPEANRMDLVAEHIRKIKNGISVTIPLYDSTTGDTGSFEEYLPRKFTIAEGEISTYPQFRDLIDFSIFIDSDLMTQLSARTGRDVKVLGHSMKKAITTFLTSNLTDFTIYGADGKQWADVHLFCDSEYHYSLEAVKITQLKEFGEILDDSSVISPEGLIVPVATPFEKDLSLCQTAFITHLSWLASKGVNRIIIGGTTAEFFSLTFAERMTLLKLAREYFPGLVLFNISADSLATVTEYAKRALRYGADALMCLPPYYYANAPVDGLIDFFSRIAEISDLPLYLYNFPKHTGNPLTAELLKRVPHAGIKDSAADLTLIPHTPRYLLGGDSKIIEAYSQRACGFIPGLPNVFPEPYLQLEDSLKAGDQSRSWKIAQRISVFKKSLPAVSGIVVVKQYLNNYLDSYPVTVRPPLYSGASAAIDPSIRLH